MKEHNQNIVPKQEIKQLKQLNQKNVKLNKLENDLEVNYLPVKAKKHGKKVNLIKLYNKKESSTNRSKYETSFQEDGGKQELKLPDINQKDFDQVH